MIANGGEGGEEEKELEGETKEGDEEEEDEGKEFEEEFEVGEVEGGRSQFLRTMCISKVKESTLPI